MVKEDSVSETASLQPVPSEEVVDQRDKSAISPISLQVFDEKEIAQRIKGLPESTRKILEEDFRARYVAIEKIDKNKLI